MTSAPWTIRKVGVGTCRLSSRSSDDHSWPAAGGHERSLRGSETRQASAEHRAALEKPEGRVWVDHCRPRTSAIRSLNLVVSFPAVRSHARPALAGPQPMCS